MKAFNIQIWDVSTDPFCRIDVDNKAFFIENDFSKYDTLSRYITFIETGKPITKEDYSTVENENIHLVVRNICDGELILDDPIYISDEKANALTLYRINKDDIILAISSNCGACFLYNETLNYNITLSHYLCRFQVDQNALVPQFLVYYLNSAMMKEYFKSTETGKTQKNLSKKYIDRIPIYQLSISVQTIAIEKARIVEKQINSKKVLVKTPQEIIDKVFSAAFNIDRNALFEVAAEKAVSSKSSDLVFNNSNIRFSFRWDKAVAIQEKLIEMCDECKRLDRYIFSTKNGWSPECSEAATSYRVLGIDAIQKSAILSLENVKFTDQTDKSVELNTVKNGDFFVSRGNTTDLVALASVADIPEEDDEPIIFPDLMIRVKFNSQVNKLYMAYAFNSFIGRLYFKYASKGKNQTMVKISQKELKDFYVPIPALDEQQRIVEEIQAEVDKQSSVKTEIAKLRSKIDAIIEEAIRG